MSAARFFLFLTFVLLCLSNGALAARTPLSPDIDDTSTTDAKPRPIELENSSAVFDISQPASGKGGTYPHEYFYPYHRSLTLRFGQIYSSTNSNSPTGLAGIALMLATEERKSYEVGADLITDGSGDLSFARRFIFSQSKLRPYAKLGAGILVHPADGLALFVNFSNYRVLASGGAEYLVWHAQSLRVDLEADVSTKSAQAAVSLGYSWAW